MIYKRWFPFDGNGLAVAALRETLRIAADRNRVIRLIHVMDSLYGTEAFADESVGDTLLTSRRKLDETQLSKARDAMRLQGHNCESAMLESHGESTARVIIADAMSWLPELIVMGTHGRTGFGRIVLGSNAAAVVAAAPVPVLLVRGRLGLGLLP